MAFGKVDAVVAPTLNEAVTSTRNKKLPSERDKADAHGKGIDASKMKTKTKNAMDTKDVDRLANEMSEFRSQYKKEQDELQKELTFLREQNAELETRLEKAERALRESRFTRQTIDAAPVAEQKERDPVDKTKQASKSVIPKKQSKDVKEGNNTKAQGGGNVSRIKDSAVATGFSSDELRQVFRRFDYNGNGLLSLAEIDKALIEGYPHLAKHKPAIMRAYKAADSSGDGFVQFREFRQLMDYLYVYDAYFLKFQGMDTNNDKRLTLEEFKSGYTDTFGSTDVDLEKEFRQIDKNGGGYVLFDEFCLYLADETQKRNSS